ncbi:MAG: trypsin-like peptidase domain-containing protein [Candidatus Portnoybacteria bacterium]|nr:trypsin-like peptidase domain-containing protein [Candidatus Portnoybacteria bacterium]
MFKTKEKILTLFLILIVGGAGGILADQFLLPYLSTIPFFSKISFIEHAGNGTTIINPTEKIIITENVAIENAIDKINPSLVAVQSYQNKGLIKQGTGFIMTSDGLIVTAADLVPAWATEYLVFRNNNFLTAQVIKRDLKNNLALLKIEEANLSVASLANLEETNLGQRIVLIGVEVVNNNLNYFVNLGVIRSINQETLRINLAEENSLANGSPLINVKGQVLGLNLVDYKGLIKTIPINEIRVFVGL